MLSTFNLYGFCLHICLCDMFPPGAQGGQEEAQILWYWSYFTDAYEPLYGTGKQTMDAGVEVELHVAVSQLV